MFEGATFVVATARKAVVDDQPEAGSSANDSDRPEPQLAENGQPSCSPATEKDVADDQAEADEPERQPTENSQPSCSATTDNDVAANQLAAGSSVSNHSETFADDPKSTPKKTTCVTPEEIRPFPKAGARKTSRSASSRKRGDTQILTDTPVKRKMEEKAASCAKQSRKKKVCKYTKVVQKKETQKKVSSMRMTKAKKKLNLVGQKQDKVKNDASCSEKCNICSATYGDKGDIRSAEDWLKCAGCQFWFHESCAQANGVLDDDDTYTCIQCVD